MCPQVQSQKCLLKCPVGSQNTPLSALSGAKTALLGETNTLNCWLKHNKLPSWEAKTHTKVPIFSGENTLYVPFFLFSPLPSKNSVHATGCDGVGMLCW